MINFDHFYFTTPTPGSSDHHLTPKTQQCYTNRLSSPPHRQSDLLPNPGISHRHSPIPQRLSARRSGHRTQTPLKLHVRRADHLPEEEVSSQGLGKTKTETKPSTKSTNGSSARAIINYHFILFWCDLLSVFVCWYRDQLLRGQTLDDDDDAAATIQRLRPLWKLVVEAGYDTWFWFTVTTWLIMGLSAQALMWWLLVNSISVRWLICLRFKTRQHCGNLVAQVWLSRWKNIKKKHNYASCPRHISVSVVFENLERNTWTPQNIIRSSERINHRVGVWSCNRKQKHWPSAEELVPPKEDGEVVDCVNTSCDKIAF